MVSCSVVGCANRTGRDKVSFFRFPCCEYKRPLRNIDLDLLILRRNTWLTRIGRQELFNKKAKVKLSRVCSDHFVQGRPAPLEDTNDVDWAPSLFLGHNYFNKDGKECQKRKTPIGPLKLKSSEEGESESNDSVKNSDISVKEMEPCNSDSNVTIVHLETEKC